MLGPCLSLCISLSARVGAYCLLGGPPIRNRGVVGLRTNSPPDQQGATDGDQEDDREVNHGLPKEDVYQVARPGVGLVELGIPAVGTRHRLEAAVLDIE